MKGGHPSGQRQPGSLAVARPEWPGAGGECENGSRRHHVETGCGKPRYVSSSLTRTGAARPQESISGLSIREGEVWLLRVLRSSAIWSPPQSFKSKKRRVQVAGNGPSADRKCWQRVELGIHGLKAGAAKSLEKSEKRGVQAAGNGPSADGKCWQRIDLGIHSLKS